MQPHARTTISLDPQRLLRPREHALHPLPTAVADWQTHLDAHRIGAPPPVPAQIPDSVIAIRDANDALFRARVVAHRTAQAEARA